MRPARLLAPALALLLVAGCARNRADEGQPAPEGGPQALLEVHNNTWSDADVFVYAGTQRIRLGTVVSLGSTHATLPPDALGLGSIQVRIQPIGGGTAYTTDRIDIRPGDRIRLTVEKQVSLSTWVVDQPGSGW